MKTRVPRLPTTTATSEAPATTAPALPKLDPSLETASDAAIWLLDALTTIACADNTGSPPARRKARLDCGLIHIKSNVEKELAAAVDAHYAERTAARAA